MRQSLRYHVIFRPEPEGGFTVIVPSLPGCVTYGRNLQEAKKMVIDAIRGYIASLKKHREPIPTDEGGFFTSIEISGKASVYA
jgi:predicted RNase H-like HicB family nuclease